MSTGKQIILLIGSRRNLANAVPHMTDAEIPHTPVSASMLAIWADVNQRRCQEIFPRFIRELILASRGVTRIDMPSDDGIQTSGWDGFVQTREGNPWVPIGISRWEIGTGKDVAAKANADYEKRSLSRHEEFSDQVFVFVTPRRWSRKRTWSHAKQNEKIWREVRVYDADDLAQWLHYTNTDTGKQLSQQFAEHIWATLFNRSGPHEHLQRHAWLDTVCKRVDFSADGSIAGLLGVEPFRPADVKQACRMPYDDRDTAMLLRDGVLSIRGGHGQGKTVRAFVAAYNLALRGYGCYFIDCASLARIKCNYTDLISLLGYLDGSQTRQVLVLDDTHLVQNFDVGEVIRLSRKSTLIVYTSVASRDVSDEIVAGRLEDPNPTREWGRSRNNLLHWIQERRTLLQSPPYNFPPPDEERLTGAISCWHFFYMLRGGTASIDNDCAVAREHNRCDLLYFLVCALRFFQYKDCTYYDVLEVCRARSWPHPKIPTAHREAWVKNGLEWLTRNHFIARDGSSFVPRHHFEAAAVMRQMQTASADKDELHQLAIRLLKGVLEPLQLSPHERRAIVSGDKYSAKTALERVRGYVDQANIFDLGLVPSPHLERFYATIWAEFAQCISRADVHHLYWIGHYIPSLNHGAMLYPPPHFVTGKLNIVCEHGADTVDFSVFVNTIIGREAIDTIGKRYQFAELCGRMLTLVDKLEAIKRLELQQKEVEQSRPQPEDAGEDPLDIALENNDRPRILELMVAGEVAGLGPFEANVLRVVALSLGPVLDDRRYELIGQRVLAATLANLDARRSAVQLLTKSLDTSALGRVTLTREAETPILLFHLWLASPERAGVLFDGLSASARRAVRLALHQTQFASGHYSSPFHASTTSPLFLAFVRWAAEIDDEIKTWYDDVCVAKEVLGRFERDAAALKHGLGVDAEVLTLRKFALR